MVTLNGGSEGVHESTKEEENGGKKKIVIIGIGPTAIGAALRITELVEQRAISAEVTMVDASDRVGGLASSLTSPRGFTWDLGVHVTGRSKYEHFLQTIDAAVPEWNYVPRCVMLEASMWHVFEREEPRPVQECYVPYPVQESINHFPPIVREKCTAELEEKARQSSSSTPANFADFASSTFGETLTDLFIRPYNEKVWTVSLSEMSSTWAGGRVPPPPPPLPESANGINNGASNPDGHMPAQIFFRYPRKLRGVGAIWERVVEQRLPLSSIRLSSPVVHVDADNKRVILGDESGSCLSYDLLISTMPIVELVKIVSPPLTPGGFLPLRHSKVVLIGIGMRRPQPFFTEQLSWLYFPHPDTVFYRCTFISNFNEEMTPNAALFWSVLLEIGVSPNAEIDEDSMKERAIRDLVREGIMDEGTEIVDRWLHILPFGYPIPTIQRDEVLRGMHESLEARDIYSRGRFGSWKYEVANQDHSFTMGRELVDRLFLGIPETVHT